MIVLCDSVNLFFVIAYEFYEVQMKKKPKRVKAK